MAMPGRFLSIFFAAHGQTDEQVGLLMATPELVSLVAGPLLCNLADRIGRRERVAAFTYFAAIVCFLIQLVALPALGLLSSSARFPVLLALRALFGFFSAPAYSLVSAIAIAQLREEHGENGHEHFGEERLWGAVSWALCALGLGFVLDRPGVDIWIVYVGVFVFGLGYIVSLYLFERAQSQKKILENDAEDNRDDRGLLDSERGVASDFVDNALPQDGTEPRAVEEVTQQQRKVVSMSTFNTYYLILTTGGPSTFMFFNLVFWLFAGMSLVEALLFLFFENDLHASNLLCGISVVVTVIFEIPLFARAPALLRRFGSAALAIGGSLAFVGRGFGYAAAPNGWFALLVEPFHGVTYAAIATASVSFVSERIPSELEATGQSLLTVIHSIAFTLGIAVGGYVMQEFGSKVMYLGAAILVLVATTAFAIVNWFCGTKHVMEAAGDDGQVEPEHSGDSQVVNQYDVKA